MSIRKRSAVGYGLLLILCVATSLTTHFLINRPANAATQPLASRVAAWRASRADWRRSQQEIRERAAANAPSQQQPFLSYRDITDIEDLSNDGQIGLLVDVECWHGTDTLPTLSEAERSNRLRVCVYSPDDPRRQDDPLVVWESTAAAAKLGLDRESVPIAIPMPPAVDPYIVTVEVVSAGPILHQPPGGDEPVFVPHGYCGTSFKFYVE